MEETVEGWGDLQGGGRIFRLKVLDPETGSWRCSRGSATRVLDGRFLEREKDMRNEIEKGDKVCDMWM
ncbi:hypothetical protein Hanom_Chr15g01340251 [Helianthus anomalus]